MPLILAVASHKGGVGKTTTVLNLGHALARLGHRVLMADFDPQNGLVYGLGLEDLAGDAGLYSLIESGGDLDAALVELPTEGLDALLAGPVVTNGASDRVLRLLADDPGRLASVIGSFANRYDFVLLDCAAGLGPLTTAALAAADAALVPVQCHPLALRTLPVLLQTLLAVRRSLNPRLELAGLLLTMYDTRVEAQTRVAEQVWTSFPEAAVLDVVIPRHDSLIQEFSGSGPVTGSLVHSVGAQAYMQLARELVARRDARSPAA